MDSSNHQPYKSKLFNLVNRRSSQWRDHLIRSAQYLRVGLEWSLQILIYPLYLMVQGGRVANKQLRKGFTQKALPIRKNKTTSSVPKVDRPLRKVFKETERCLGENKTKRTTQEYNNKTTPIMIQGVASEIESHDLVLVDENNTIVDILSETQQTHLKKYIRLETANYWYDLKQYKKNEGQSIPIFSSKDDQILPPIRWFWQVMGWMQTGTLAMNLDLFGECSLVPAIPQNTVTSLSTTSGVPQSESNLKSLDLSFSVNQKVQELRKHFKQKSSESLNIDNEDPFRIEFLIYAAIDYFFNRIIPHEQLNSNSREQQLQLSTVSDHSFVTVNTANSWLSWDDLYPEVPSVHSSSSVVSSSKFLSQSDPSSGKTRAFSQKRKRARVHRSKSQKSLSQSTSKLQKQKTSKKSIVSQGNQKIQKNPSNWLETEAKTTGYVKHPLVRVLEWLDSAIHWLEKLVNRLSKFFRKRY